MNPNVDVVDILSVRELTTAVLANVTPAWWGIVCDPATGISYKMTYDNITSVISSIIGSGIIEPDRYYVVNRGQPNDPVLDGDTVNDTYLDGKVYSLELRGIGFLEKGVEWDNDVVGGGWRLLGGATFSDAAFYTVHFHPQISPVISTPDAIGKFVSGVQLISGNTTITSGMFRKLIVLTSGYTVTLNATWPENVIMPITHNGVTNKQGVIVAPGGQSFAWNGGTTSTLWLGKSEDLNLIRSGNTWYVAPGSTMCLGYAQIGHIVPGRLPGANQLIAQGQTVLRSDYPRLLDYITRLNAAYPGVVANAAQWPANRTLWGFGDGSTTIQVPDLRGYFPRWLDLGAGIDQDRNDGGIGSKPGTSQSDEVREHNHKNGIFDRLLSSTGQGTATGFDPGGANDPDLRTSEDILPFGGKETRPINAAELPLIYV